MKKVFLVLVLMFSLIILSGCFKSRDELFDIPVVSGTFYSQKEDISYLGKVINEFSITFTNMNEITEKLDGYQVNEFGDYSNGEIKLFSISVKMNFDNNIYECDATFLGMANPGRSNAYLLEVLIPFEITIPDLNSKQKVFLIVLDFEKNDNNLNGLESINIQIKDNYNSGTEGDTVFDVIIQTEE